MSLTQISDKRERFEIGSFNDIKNCTKTAGGKTHIARYASESLYVRIDLFLCMKDPKTRSREITSLLCAMKELGLGTGKIITLDEKNILKEGDKTIEIIPA